MADTNELHQLLIAADKAAQSGNQQAAADVNTLLAQIDASKQDAPPPDKYRQEAAADYEKQRAAGIPLGDDYTTRVQRGVGMGVSDEIGAALATPWNAYKKWDSGKGVLDNIGEGYKYAKAKEDYWADKAAEKTGTLGTVAEMAGGIIPTIALAPLSWTTKLDSAATLGARAIAGAKDGAILGAISGWGGGRGLEDSVKGGVVGGVAGGAVGGALPAAVDAVRWAAKPVTSWASRMRGAEKFGDRQTAQAVMEAGKTPRAVEREVQSALRSGHDGYTVADAVGKPAQDRLRSVVSSPGDASSKVMGALDARQADQTGRVSQFLADALDATLTAAQQKSAIEATRKAAADVAFPAARNNAGRVNLKGAVKTIDDLLAPSASGGRVLNNANLADDSVEKIMGGFRSRLTDGKVTLSDYNAAERLYHDLSDAAFKNRGTNLGRHLSALKRSVSDAMEKASKGFKAANAQSSMYHGMEDAVDFGATNALKRTRVSDALDVFGKLNPEQRAPHNVGFADKLITALPDKPGADATQNLLGKQVNAKIGAFVSPDKARDLSQRIGRESVMSKTRSTAGGGSSTSKNLNFDAEIDNAGAVSDIARGNWLGAASKFIGRSGNALTGKTEPVRSRMADILMMGQATPGEITNILSKPLASLNRKEMLIRMLISGSQGAGTTNARLANEKGN
tara:strand:+ start:2994 stop:5036 length:2043 start_codon:yes stop_codon:yes gene_type:complete